MAVFVVTQADLDAEAYNTRIILASTIIVLIISNVSYVLRLVARRMQNQKLQADDYIMGLALPFSYVPAVCMFYGLTVGLGKHVQQVSAPELKKFNISLFILQRGNPPCLFCVKTSILILYTRLFRTQTFKRVAFSVWVFTALWAIAAFTSNILQCTPVSYFWNKTQPGHCIPNALVVIGMTNGVLSFVGDLIILALPIPMVWKLQINARRKLALTAMFLLGGFVCLTSIFRFIALAQINVKDITYTQVAPGIWTYVELGIGITCGNLPLLRPLFGRYFGSGSRTGTSATPKSNQPSNYALSRNAASGFQKMDRSEVDVESGSEIELNTKIRGGMNENAERDNDAWEGEGIKVKRDVDLRIEEVRSEIEKETTRVQQRAAR